MWRALEWKGLSPRVSAADRHFTTSFVHQVPQPYEGSLKYWPPGARGKVSPCPRNHARETRGKLNEYVPVGCPPVSALMGGACFFFIFPMGNGAVVVGIDSFLPETMEE